MCEFITGGGLNAAPLPKSLVKEGTLMRDALLRDISTLHDYAVITTHDARLDMALLPAVEMNHVISTAIDTKDDCWLIWQQLIAKADLVWLIAPESDDVLLKLSMLCMQHNKPMIGCHSIHVIATTSSKYATFKLLEQADILTIPTFTRNNYFPLCDDVLTHRSRPRA